MGTGGDDGGKKGGSGGKRPPEDKVKIEDYPNKGEEEDSSSETSLELEVDPQQLALAGLDRPLLRLRLTPRRRVVAAAPSGGGSPPPLGGELKLCRHEKGQMVEGLTNLLRVVEGHHNHQMVRVEELAHHLWKEVGGCLSDWQVEEELLNLVVMEVAVGMVMRMEGVVDCLPQGEMAEEVAMMMVIMEMMVEEMIHHHHQIKDNHNAAEIREIDGCMWYKDHLDLQANQDRMEGMARMDKYLSCPEE